VVVGASSGGMQAVATVLSGLPKKFESAILVVVHLDSNGTSILPALLRKSTYLPVVHPTDRQAIQGGIVYVAPTNRHLLVEKDRMRVLKSPPENLHRPAIDPLFRSAAFYYRARVIGVLLTGGDSDGTSGLFSIKMKGGLAIVQDPREAQAPLMPFAAVTHLKLDYVRPVHEIGPLLVSLVFNGRKPSRG